MKEQEKENYLDGFTDEKLEKLAGPVASGEMGCAPWVYWDSENSSFGRTFREWTGYPSCLPICVASEHGVAWEPRLMPHVLEHNSNVYITWNYKLYIKLKENTRKISVYAQHPWVEYRKKNYPIEKIKESKGTVAFVPHVNHNSELIFDFKEYVNNLRNLPSKCQPVVLCVMSHDVNKGAHKELRKFGLPLITAGNTNSQYFVDRFYCLVRNFKYATSPDIGSQVFYAIEAGVPYFLTNEDVARRFTSASINRQKGEVISEKKLPEESAREAKYIREKISNICDEVTEEQKTMAEYYLGVGSELTGQELRAIFYRELLSNKKKMVRIYLKKIVNIVKIRGKKVLCCHKING